MVGLGGEIAALDCERLLVVAPDSLGRGLADGVQRRFRELHVATSRSYLSAIADLSRQPARAVVACVEAGMPHLPEAVAGLRAAAGERTRIVLCCTPETEPMARSAQRSGADDYVLHPLRGNELDAAIGCTAVATTVVDMPPVASLDELTQLGDVLAGLVESPGQVMERAASLIRDALGATGATIVVQGSAVTAGERVVRPVLTAALSQQGRVVGQLLLGDRKLGPYSVGDARKLEHYAAVIGHIVHAANRQRQLHKLAVTDECSGLPNRRYLLERLDEILGRAGAERFPVTLLLFDVDDFKGYNDSFGHAVGDAIIKSTGQLFRRLCREQDVVARYGGDEFVVVFWDPDGPRVPGSKHPDCALVVLERVRSVLQKESLEGLGPQGRGLLTISGGLATYPWDAADAKQLIARADEALLAAKRAGKNRVHIVGGEENLKPKT